MITNSFQPYLRRVEVLVGPLSELMGGGSKGEALRFYGDGTNNNFRIAFSVNKQLPTTCTPTSISIYNLSPGTRSTLHVPKTAPPIDLIQNGAKVVLNVGWENGDLVQVFQGTMLSCYSQRQGPDIITTMMSLAGAGDLVSSITPSPFTRLGEGGPTSIGSGNDTSSTFVKGQSVSEIVYVLATNFPSIAVDKKNIVIKEYNLGSAGWTFAGPVAEGLDKLSRQYGFSWWIDNGKFYAKDDKTAFPTQNVISSSNGLLLRAEPMLTGPFSQNIGASIYSLLNPYIDLGTQVKLESEINADLNGYYTPYSIRHTGDTHSDQWTTAIETQWYNMAGAL